MKPDNIINPVGPGSDELVPSRYALRIGDIEVLVISDGVLPLPTETMSTNVDPAAREKWFKDMFLGPDAFDWALNVLVVRSGDQTILIDAGLGGQFDGFPRAGQSLRRIEAAGIDLGSVTDVILTHMHMDHVGGLLGDEVKSRLRPDLRIHVAAAEVDFWAAPDFSQTDMPDPVPEVLRSTAKQFLDQYHNKLQTFEDEHEVAPGVVARRTGGHTPGHSVITVTAGEERLTFAGDIVFPVAGGTGVGSAAAAASSGGQLSVMWVDTDGCESVAQYCKYFLTSVTKNLSGSVQEYLSASASGKFPKGNYVGTLENDGTGLAPFHDFDSKVPSDLKTQLDQVKADIISGKIKITSPSQPK